VARCKERLREASNRLRQAQVRLAGAQKVFGQAEQRYNAITALRQNAFDEKKHKVGEMNDIVQELISVYRHGYARAARMTEQPASFGPMPKIEVPETFHQLDWKCVQVSEEIEPVSEVAQEEGRRALQSPTSSSPSEPASGGGPRHPPDVLQSPTSSSPSEPVPEVPQQEEEAALKMTPQLYQEKEKVE
jgi:hypothetical protein